MNDGFERMWKETFVALSQYFPGVNEGNHEKLSAGSRSLGLDLNPGPPEYKA
jgi:hypothetical protein